MAAQNDMRGVGLARPCPDPTPSVRNPLKTQGSEGAGAPRATRPQTPAEYLCLSPPAAALLAERSRIPRCRHVQTVSKALASLLIVSESTLDTYNRVPNRA